MQVLSVYQLISVYVLFLFINQSKDKYSAWFRVRALTLIKLSYYWVGLYCLRWRMYSLDWLAGLTQRQLIRLIGALIIIAVLWVAYGLIM